VSETRVSGRLAYYVERAARQNLIAFHTANSDRTRGAPRRVDPIFGPIPWLSRSLGGRAARGRPLERVRRPGASCSLRKRIGRKLDSNMAVDASGESPMIRRPPSGCHSSGASIGGTAVLSRPVLGILAGSKVVIDDVEQYGFFFIVFDPELLMPVNQFKQSRALRDTLHRSALPRRRASACPGGGEQARRKRGLERGTISVMTRFYDALLRLHGSSRARAAEASLGVASDPLASCGSIFSHPASSPSASRARPN